MGPYELDVKSGVVDASVEGVLFLVSLLLCLYTLDRIRALSLEHKLRRGGVVSLDRHSLTCAELSASILVLVGLPVMALITSLGRNGETAPIYNTVRGVVDVWDTDLVVERPLLLYKTGANSVLRCGLDSKKNVHGLSPQAVTVGRKDGKGGRVYCPGDFKNFIDGFVQEDPVVIEVPPKSRRLYPASLEVKRTGDWRSQCFDLAEEERGCFTWKWTQKAFTVCSAHLADEIPDSCTTYTLAPDAPEIDTDRAGPKVMYGSVNGAGLAILIAHYTVSKLVARGVEVTDDTRQVTVIATWSWVGVLVVLGISLAASLLACAASFWARLRWGYKLRLHSYSGLAAYAASLEDTRNYGSTWNGESFSAAGGSLPRAMGRRRKAQRPRIRLREGNSEFAGLVSIGQNPEVKGVRVALGELGTGFDSADGMHLVDDYDESLQVMPLPTGPH